MPAAAVSRVLERSADESGLEDFGLRLAGLRRLATLGPLSVVLSQEPDLRSALTLLCRYEHSYNEALRLRLDEDGDLATMRLWFEFGEPAPTRQATELATATLLGIVRELLGRQWEPLSMCFTHRAPASLDAHRAVFGPRLQFGHEFSGLVFYATELDAANTASDPLLRPYADQLRKALGAPPAATVTGQVTQLVEMLLPVGRCSTSPGGPEPGGDAADAAPAAGRRGAVVLGDRAHDPGGAGRAVSRGRPLLAHRRLGAARLHLAQRLLPVVPPAVRGEPHGVAGRGRQPAGG